VGNARAAGRRAGRFTWPYQLIEIERLRFEDRYGRVLPVGVEPGSTVDRGFRLFRDKCLSCHSINLQGGGGVTIDRDLLIAAREMARRERTCAGRVVFRLLRQALARFRTSAGDGDTRGPEAFYGFRPFASRGDVASNDLVGRIRD